MWEFLCRDVGGNDERRKEGADFSFRHYRPGKMPIKEGQGLLRRIGLATMVLPIGKFVSSCENSIMRRFDLVFGIGLAFFTVTGAAQSQEPAPQSGGASAAAVTTPPANEAKPATASVELGPVQKTISVAGQFVAQDAHEIHLDLKAVSSFESLKL
jgi:hypothetical protein